MSVCVCVRLVGERCHTLGALSSPESQSSLSGRAQTLVVLLVRGAVGPLVGRAGPLQEGLLLGRLRPLVPRPLHGLVALQFQVGGEQFGVLRVRQGERLELGWQGHKHDVMVNGLRLYSAFLTRGHSKRFTISPHIHPSIHKFTHQQSRVNHAGRQPARREQSG